MKFSRKTNNGEGALDDFTATVSCALLNVVEQAIDAIESGDNTKEFETELISNEDQPPIAESSVQVAFGRKYRVRVKGKNIKAGDKGKVYIEGREDELWCVARAYKVGDEKAEGVFVYGDDQGDKRKGKVAIFEFHDSGDDPLAERVLVPYDEEKLVTDVYTKKNSKVIAAVYYVKGDKDKTIAKTTIIPGKWALVVTASAATFSNCKGVRNALTAMKYNVEYMNGPSVAKFKKELADPKYSVLYTQSHCGPDQGTFHYLKFGEEGFYPTDVPAVALFTFVFVGGCVSGQEPCAEEFFKNLHAKAYLGMVGTISPAQSASYGTKFFELLKAGKTLQEAKQDTPLPGPGDMEYPVILGDDQVKL